MITELVIVSAIVSAIVQVIKKITKISGLYALLTLLVISVVGAFIYTGFEVLGYWEQVVAILTVASGIFSVVNAAYKEVRSNGDSE